MKSCMVDRGCTPAPQGRHQTGGVLSLFSSVSFNLSIKNSVQVIFRLSRPVSCKIRKMAQESNDLSTLPLNIAQRMREARWTHQRANVAAISRFCKCNLQAIASSLQKHESVVVILSWVFCCLLSEKFVYDEAEDAQKVKTNMSKRETTNIPRKHTTNKPQSKQQTCQGSKQQTCTRSEEQTCTD